MRELSLGYLTLPRASAADLVYAAGAAEVAWAGPRIAGRTAEDHGDWPAYSTSARRALGAALRSTGVRVLDVSAMSVTAQVSVATFLPVFDCAAEVGAKVACVSVYDPDMRRAADIVCALAQSARGFGITLGLEFVPFSQVRTLEAALAIVQRSDAADSAVIIDMMHLVRSGGRPEALQTIPRERLCFAQICDGPARASPTIDELRQEARAERMLPGDGAFPIDAILAALPPELPVEVEVPSTQAAGLGDHDYARHAVARTRSYLAARAAPDIAR